MPKRNNSLSNQIGMRIYKKRKELGLTQEELAYRSGLSQSFLACIERGEKGPGFDSIIRISRALGTSTDYLLMGVMPKEESSYVDLLFGLMSEEQRMRAIDVLKNILLFSGYTPPEQ